MRFKKPLIIASYAIGILVFSFILDRVILYIYQLKVGAAYISVTDSTGPDNVYIDNTFLCKTPCINKDLPEGLHEVKISKADNTSKYYTFSEKLLFEKSANNLINITLGPNLNYTYYSIYLLKQIPTNDSRLFISINNPNNIASISANDKSLNSNEENTLPSNTYSLNIKRKNYQDYQGKVTLNNGYLTYITIHQASKPF